MGQGAVRLRRSRASCEVDKTRVVMSNVGAGVQMDSEGVQGDCDTGLAGGAEPTQVQPTEPHGSTAGAGKDV